MMKTFLFSIYVIGFTTLSSATDSCVDNIHNCESYGKSACQGPYQQWAHKNCARYCGICVTIAVPTTPMLAPTAGTCRDAKSNCADYGKDVCSAYIEWSRQNCAHFCGFCHDVEPCGDIANCIDYQDDVCTAFPKWASINCRKYCHFCGSTDSPVHVLDTLPPQLAGCYFKGHTYHAGDVWVDGCDYNCTCLDGSRGYYRCQDLCLTFHIPPTCTMEPPAEGKCCKQPKCPPNIHINFPDNYQIV